MVDSNHPPLPYQGNALTNCATGRYWQLHHEFLCCQLLTYKNLHHKVSITFHSQLMNCPLSVGGPCRLVYHNQTI